MFDSMVATLLDHKFLPEKEVLQLCERARNLISEESNVHLVRAPVTVVAGGDPPRSPSLQPHS